MPLYDVEYVTPLSPDQQAALAGALTDLHCTRFRTPRFFLNVRYADVRHQVVFRAGRRVHYNRIILRTRASDSDRRPKHVYDEHCRDIIDVWASLVGTGPERGLRTVWVLGALTTAVECGIARPNVGDEEQWLEANMDHFRKLAASGDADFVELVREIDGDAEKIQGSQLALSR
ncbi:hypothetical protein A1O3_07634 [Capronia epimyces CBS 606.96]|uniref:Tautomerase cis-CaaD-like domain-containing protein n=1 Tax=Capronia epimyces CBS 606.96 TaxID=1182542 RepID=W9YGF5_9EURO|nr:uncharacterized protein A1O3_07634 [Capronia epimyces CBS 606.96]EXJ81344.1 hypothetical protein A1O3_07634 [Capronia epimyces CBS 606.96]